MPRTPGATRSGRAANDGLARPEQKHAGFEMEHAYAKHPHAAKNFYLLLQIAHILSPMFQCYCQGKAAVKHDHGSLRNLARDLLESWRRDPVPEPDRLRPFLDQAIQIRPAGLRQLARQPPDLRRRPVRTPGFCAQSPTCP